MILKPSTLAITASLIQLPQKYLLALEAECCFLSLGQPLPLTVEAWRLSWLRATRQGGLWSRRGVWAWPALAEALSQLLKPGWGDGSHLKGLSWGSRACCTEGDPQDLLQIQGNALGMFSQAQNHPEKSASWRTCVDGHSSCSQWQWPVASDWMAIVLVWATALTDSGSSLPPRLPRYPRALRGHTQNSSTPRSSCVPSWPSLSFTGSTVTFRFRAAEEVCGFWLVGLSFVSPAFSHLPPLPLILKFWKCDSSLNLSLWEG